MAIKFGDILQNQNSAYPIVEASNNDIKGVIFSTSLPGNADFPNKRALGTILIDNTVGSQKMYIYKGGDLLNATWGNNNNWEVFATGTGETIQTSNLPVSIPTGRSFGRFVNGDEINVGDGESAMQIIIDAITAYVAPTGQFTNSSTDVNYSLSSQSITHSVTFQVFNQNQAVVAGNTTSSAFAIREVKLLRKLGNGDYTEIANATPSVNDFAAGTFADLNTQGSVTAETFNFADTVSVASGSDDFTYKVVITPNDGAGNATTDQEFEGADGNSGFIDCADYDGPGITGVSVVRQDTSSHFNTSGSGNSGSETNTRRPKGNIASKITFTLDNDSPLVPITGYSLRRSINGGTPVEIFSESNLSIVGTTNGQRKIFDSIQTGANNVTGLNTDVTGFTDVTSAFPSGSTDADTIQYSITITDGEGTTNAANIGSEINLEFPGMIGFGTTDGSSFSSSNNSTMTTLLQAIRDTSGLRAQYEIISTADNQAVDPDFGVVAINPTSTQFVYIGFPAAMNEIDTILDPNNVQSYGAFGSAPKSTNVSFTTKYGVTGTYEFYCSNGAGALSGNHTIN